MGKISFLLFLGIVVLFGCNNPSIKEKTFQESKPKSKENKAKEDSLRNVFEKDSIDNLFYQDKLYFQSIIRLEPRSRKFIFNDQLEEVNYEIDSSNREDYYKNAIKQISKIELKVHKFVWSFPEILNNQKGDGGYLTKVSWIEEFPTIKNPYYTVSIKTNDIWKLSSCYPIGWVKIRKDFKRVLFCDAGDCIEVKKWRKINIKK